MKSEMQRVRHTIWAVAFFLSAIYLIYHGKYGWGAYCVIGMLFHDFLSFLGDKDNK